MQLQIFLFTLLSVSSAAVTCGWDAQMVKADCQLFLNYVKQSNSAYFGKANYQNCHVMFSQDNAIVSKNTLLSGLQDCLTLCAKFDHIYCRVPRVPMVGGGVVDIILGTHK